MTEQNFGTVTALEFRVPPDQGFEDIVEEFDISFRPLGLTRRSLIWDGEDIAIIERDSIRIVLAWLPPVCHSRCHFLIIAVGQTPNSRGVVLDPNTCGMLSSLLINHARSYLPVGRVFEAEATQPVGTELIDTISELLYRDFQDSAPESDDDTMTQGEEQWDQARGYQAYDFDPAIYDTAPGERVRTGAADILDADYVDLSITEEISLPKKLTIYTLGATMLLYTPPVGATLLVYTTLRDFVPDYPRRLERTAA